MRVVACLLLALALALQCAAQQSPVMRILHAYPAQVPLTPVRPGMRAVDLAISQSSLSITLVFSNGTQKAICTLNFGKQCTRPLCK